MKKRGLAVASAVNALYLAACGGGGGSAPSGPSAGAPSASASLPAAPAARQKFTDVTASTGIAYVNGIRGTKPAGYVAKFANSGAAAGDYDDDGDIDLFITRGDIGRNLLYRNNGLGVFDEVSQSAGLAFTANATENYRHSSPIFADMDGDGDLDLFIGSLWKDPAFIYANNGDGTFTNVTAGSGIDEMKAAHSIAAAFGDYDLDGDLDLFITHFGTERDRWFPGDTEHLWRNDSSNGVIRFTSVSVEARISPSIVLIDDPLRILPGDFTITPTFARIDDDLYPDLLVVSDANLSQVFRNNRSGTFTNVTDVDVIIDHAGMGAAVGDYDNDGDLDWFVTSIGGDEYDDPARPIGNRLYGNRDGTFVDITLETGVAGGGWGWGTCFLDLENDGDLDLYQTNGWAGWDQIYIDDTSRAFESDGTGHFTNEAAKFGLNDTDEGRGVVCADFDNDGDTDVLQLHTGSPVAATMWRNDTSGNNYLRVKLNGRSPNTEAAGARLFVTVGARTQMREIMIGNNFMSQNPTLQVVGLGLSAQADVVEVEWPDGERTRLTAVAAGQTLTIDQPPL
jgi:enediyne biosynthesis protein E4